MITLPNPNCCFTDNPNHLCQKCKAMLRNQNAEQPSGVLHNAHGHRIMEDLRPELRDVHEMLVNVIRSSGYAQTEKQGRQIEALRRVANYVGMEGNGPVHNCNVQAIDNPDDYYPDPPVINWAEDSAFNRTPSPQSNPTQPLPASESVRLPFEENELVYNSNPNDEDDYYPDPPIINWAAESAFRP